jgi:tetratricopeptide (TPR) repeat protein
MTVAKVLLHHILLLLFPLKLNADYSYNAFPVATGLLDMRVLFSLAVLLVIFLLIVRALASRPMAAFAGLWFFVTLLPTYHIIPHHELLAEHYLYLPMFAFAFLAAWGVDYALERSERRSALVWAAAALVLIAFSVRTIHRNRDWKDDLTLWKKTVKTAPQCARAHVNLGKALIAQGDLKWAIAELKTALQIKPDLPTAFANLGVAYGSMDMYDEAVRSFEKALQVHPRFPGAYYNLGLTLARKGDMDGAAAAFEKAVAMDPNMSAAHYNLGLVYLKRGDSVRARRHLSRAAGLLPDSPTAARAREALRGLGDR